MGYSIAKVFNTIEAEVRKHVYVDSLTLPNADYSLRSMWRNVQIVNDKLKSGEYDIVHITGTEHYLLPFLRAKRKIVTVHDLGFYTNHRNDAKSWLKRLFFINTLKCADHVVFISQKSKDEAAELVSLKHQSVIHDCYAGDITYRDKPFSYPPTVLQIGTKENKNVGRVIEALSGLDVQMRFVGPLSALLLGLLKKYDIKFTQTQDLTDEQVAEEYMNCDIVSFPSLSEGFGMPVIEGQAAGKVVVTSNIRPMSDICGDNAILVDPYDLASIRQGFVKALSRPQETIASGLLNAQKYTAEAIANEYLSLYKDLCESIK